MQKLQLQNQLAAYLTSEEIQMILAMAKKVSTDADKQLGDFKQVLRKKRLEMIDKQWSKEKLEVVSDDEIQAKRHEAKRQTSKEIITPDTGQYEVIA